MKKSYRLRVRVRGNRERKKKHLIKIVNQNKTGQKINKLFKKKKLIKNCFFLFQPVQKCSVVLK